ncbi:MAG: M15 family metallopeptidase [Campylobacterales bacterium]|nr:M15 family metallopeptidase [Campylobacterales bacterium]
MKRREFLLLGVSTPLLANDLFFASDVILSQKEWDTLVSLRNRLNLLKRYVGYANFNVISYSEALYYGRNYSSIGAFSSDELELMDKFFYENPSKYGFFGKKTCAEIDHIISEKDIYKIEHAGHFLFKGKPLADFERLQKDVGDTLVLTSGIRNVIKQMSLYVNKIYRTRGNITQASYSIAPPAYSYHTISDFDVGRKGWGYKNFTADFATTQEFIVMKNLNYIGMRYKKNNKDGVRFEPWHVEVI